MTSSFSKTALTTPLETLLLKMLRISREHDEIMKRYGLDRHAASAYLIALRGLRNQ